MYASSYPFFAWVTQEPRSFHGMIGKTGDEAKEEIRAAHPTLFVSAFIQRSIFLDTTTHLMLEIIPYFFSFIQRFVRTFVRIYRFNGLIKKNCEMNCLFVGLYCRFIQTIYVNND